MGVNKKKLQQLDLLWNTVNELKETVNKNLGDDMLVTKRDDGSEEDTTALVFMDLPSFTTFDPIEKKLFEMALAKSDAVNFFSLPDEWIRVSFAVFDEYEPEYSEPDDSKVIQLHRRE